MLMRRLIAYAGAVAMLVALSGCAGLNPPHGEPEMPLPVGTQPAPDGLKFSVKVTPSRFRLGDSVKLEATMFNNSGKRFERDFPSGCQWSFQVTRDVRILGPAVICTQMTTRLVLEPGELRMIVRDFGGSDRYFELNDPLRMGTYQISAGLIENGRVVPMSDPVTVEVLPR